MGTISENLQTIKNSVSAIKQAIIDKGGDVSGDISTWASAISGISGGGSSSSEEYTFTGTISYNMSEVTIAGSLNKVPDTGRNYLLALGWYTGGLCRAYNLIINTGPYTLIMDFDEPISGNEIPAMCILNIVENTFTVIPVKFIQQTPIKFYVNNIEYDALYPMDWEQFINSETYNPTLTDINGDSYKAFLIKDGIVHYELLYDGELDMQVYVYTSGNFAEISTNIIKENTYYLAS